MSQGTPLASSKTHMYLYTSSNSIQLPKKDGPTYLQTKLKVNHSQRSTRNSAQDKYTINLVTQFNRRKIYADHGFTFTAAQQRNKLPSHIKNYTNIKKFKKHLENHLDTQVFHI